VLSAYAYDAHADDVPLLGVLRTSVVIGAPACRGGYLCPHANQSRPSFQQRPAKGAAFQKIGMSFTVTTYEGVFLRVKKFPSLRPSYRLSRSRRSHFVLLSKSRAFLMSIASVTVRSPAPSVTVRECRCLFNSLVLPRLDLTTQARHRARPTQPSTGTVCPARTDASRSA